MFLKLEKGHHREFEGQKNNSKISLFPNISQSTIFFNFQVNSRKEVFLENSCSWKDVYFSRCFFSHKVFAKSWSTSQTLAEVLVIQLQSWKFVPQSSRCSTIVLSVWKKSVKYFKMLSRANKWAPNDNIRSVILENKTTNVKSLKYWFVLSREHF